MYAPWDACLEIAGNTHTAIYADHDDNAPQAEEALEAVVIGLNPAQLAIIMQLREYWWDCSATSRVRRRLEITSSGSLHFGLTPETLFETHESLARNPLIARTFYRRGLIETWGRGTVKMAEVAAAAGLPHPEIEDAGGSVTVRFRHGKPSVGVGIGVGVGAAAVGQNVMGELTQRQRTVLTILDEADGPLALREISSSLGPETNERQLREDLARLKGKRLVMPTGHGRGARWRRA